MSMTRTTAGILLTTAIALAASAVISLPAAAQDATRGQEVYTEQKCQLCHAIAKKGNKANPLDGVGKKLTADETRQWITNPVEMAAKVKSTKKPPMQNKYGDLPAADLDALVAYMQSLK